MHTRISASTQTVALSALLFLYRDVLKQELPYIKNIERAKRTKSLPVVFTRHEVQLVLARLDGISQLIASLLYGSGLRLMEALRLRVKDIDFERQELTVRQGKGAKDRMTIPFASFTRQARRVFRPAVLRLVKLDKIIHEAVSTGFSISARLKAAKAASAVGGALRPAVKRLA